MFGALAFDPTTGLLVPDPLPDVGAPLIPSGPTWRGTRLGNRLFGTGTEERFQTWPEKLVRSAVTLPGDVASGEQALLPAGLRREDYTDAAPAARGAVEGIFGNTLFTPQPWQPNDPAYERAQDTAGLAGGGMMFGRLGAEATLGSGPVMRRSMIDNADQLRELANQRRARGEATGKSAPGWDFKRPEAPKGSWEDTVARTKAQWETDKSRALAGFEDVVPAKNPSPYLTPDDHAFLASGQFLSDSATPGAPLAAAEAAVRAEGPARAYHALIDPPSSASPAAPYHALLDQPARGPYTAPHGPEAAPAAREAAAPATRGNGLRGAGGGDARLSEAARSPAGIGTATSIKFSTLPDDMQVLLGDFIAGNSDKALPSHLPVTTVRVADLPHVGLDDFDRGPQYAREMNLAEISPIVIANGQLMDGKHRIFQARETGVGELPAIDLTGIVDSTMLADNSMGKIGTGGARTVDEAQTLAARRAGTHQPLEGLPIKAMKIGEEYFVPGPIAKVRDVAAEYMAGRKTSSKPPEKYHPIDEEHATAIARAFDEMPHAPDDPAVKASYDALIRETQAQYEAIKKTGLKIEAIRPDMPDPYAANPRLAAKDVADNNHLWYFPTDSGFGSNPAGLDMAKHPMMRATGEKLGGRELLANDIFRIVHDYFGHLKEGYGFRAAGEDNAWRSHASMYSDLARPAMTTETRGQNSWLNYGPHGEANRKASAADTVYAEQKVGLMPEWTMRDRGSPKQGEK